MEVYKYKKHVFGAKSLPTCANSAMLLVAKDNAVNDENLVRIVNLYMDNLLKSVRTPQEAIEIYQKVRDILIKGGFTSDDEVTSQIPESDRSTKVVRNCKAEPQSSSIIELAEETDQNYFSLPRRTNSFIIKIIIILVPA